MDYIIIEIKPVPTILCDVNNDPIICKTLVQARRKQGLGKNRIIVPLTDLFGRLDAIKIHSNLQNYGSHYLSHPEYILNVKADSREQLNEIFLLIDEIL